MSWCTTFQKPVKKADAVAELNSLGMPGEHSAAAVDQLATAKRAAKMLLHNIAGPYVQITLSGHANGVGWQKKEGSGNDTITVSVTQMCDEDIR